MKRLSVFSSALLAALLLGFAAGCDNDNPSGPITNDPTGIASIEMRVSNNQIRGFTGDERSQEIVAIARDCNGVALPNVKLSFAIQSPQNWKGTLTNASETGLTDENGQMRATYSVVIERSGDVVIEARSGQVSAAASINLIVVNDVIGSLTMEASRQVIAVPPNQTKQATVTATLVDVDGNALAGMEVRLRTSPSSLGFVDGETAVTDYNGRAVRSFSTIVNKYGTCDVIAEVGSFSGQTSIEIRPVAAPAAIKMSAETPLVKIGNGQSAFINIIAVVTDVNRVGVPETPVAFEIHPVDDESPSFGSLSAPEATDEDGSLAAVFNSLGEFGRLRVKARVLPSDVNLGARLPHNPGGDWPYKGKGGSVITGVDEDEISAEIVIEVRDIADDVRYLTVRAFPDFLNLPPDSNGTSQVLAQVRDVNNVGVPSVKVDFTTSMGSLSNATITDNGGVASATFHNNYESGVALIIASVPGTGFSATAQVVVQQSAGATGTLSLTVDRDFIYADNGLTTANLTALLSDEDGQALCGKQITFTKTHGTVNSPVTTDSLGVARAVFRDVGEPSVDEHGNIIPAVVKAKYNPLGLEAAVAVTIRPRNPVASIVLQSAAPQMVAGRSDSTSIRAVCFLTNGSFAPAGTLVRFECDNGRFTSDAVPISDNFGVAETGYIVGNVVGTATLHAKVQNSDGEFITSNPVMIDLLPGPPCRIVLNAEPNSLVTNDPNLWSTITAVVSDTANNAVAAGTLVRFVTTLGNITPSAITSATGMAQARLTAGVSAGLAEVAASIQTGAGVIEGRTTVTFVAGSANSIELTAEPLNIAVAGTGGVSTSTLRALVRDPNGNLVETSTMVVFELLNEPALPAGCNINNRGQRDSSLTANGAAVVSLNAGTQSGGKLIRAYTWRDGARSDTVTVTLPTVAVVSGPPHSLDIDMNDRGVNALGGAWKIEVSARVYDLYRNPVANNIPVVFTVEPDIASISAGFTGNRGQAGNAEPGLAYADLIYQSSQTFSPITVSARVVAPRGQITGSKDHLLPLQEGRLELHTDPANWLFDRSNQDEMCEVRVWVVLKDGHQALINNAPILFRAEKGRLWWYDYNFNRYNLFFPQTVRKYTGVVDQANIEEPGQATVYLRGTQDEFFFDVGTPNVSVQMEAAVEGYDEVIADPRFVFLNRR